MKNTGIVYPKPTYAWTLVTLLSLAYVSSFIDRYILGLLIEPIKASTGASDTQMGFLSTAFTLTYALIALPLGFLIDRRSRTKIVAVGIFLWSAATVWTGLAKNFVLLFMARMGVGIGEAVLSPAALSMIGDSFPKEKRGLPLAIYSMSLVIGAGIASLISSAVLNWAKSVDSVIIPVFGEIETWQYIFILVGLPSFLLAFIFFLIREPERTESKQRKNSKFSDAFIFISKKAHKSNTRFTIFGLEIPFFFLFVTPFCCMVAVAYGGFFNAPLFSRTWGWDSSKYALVNGIVILTISPIAYILAGKLSDHWVNKGIKDAPFKIALIGLFIMIPATAIYPLMPNGYVAFALVIFSNIGLALLGVTGVTALLNIVPGDIRGVVTAMYYLCISILGGSLSPPLIGWINDAFFAGTALRNAMAIYPLIFGLPIMLISPLLLKMYRQELESFEQTHA